MHGSTIRIPDRILRTLLARGIVLWILTRLFGKAVLAATQSGAVLLPAWTIVMTALVALIDFQIRHELTLFHNLGISTRRAMMVSAIPACVGEAVLVVLMP